MALTGRAEGPPLAPPPGLVARLEELARRVRRQAAFLGTPLAVRWEPIVLGRAAVLGLHRRGQVSPNGTCRLLRARDGWVAVNLARPDDVAAVDAITGGPSGADAWSALAQAAAASSSAELVGRARLLGVPAACLGERPAGVEPPWCAFERHRLWPPTDVRRRGEVQVVDLSSMWAGPLVAKLLADTGAVVTKVESTTRPDGTRATPAFYRMLHPAEQVERRIDFGSERGRQELRDLLAQADVVIESARPRALAQLGASPHDLPPRRGRVWVSITGHGRGVPAGNWVAFGDDAAVAGGLVAWEDQDLPLFCGDAIADPATGMVGALAALQAMAEGGGVLLDVALARVAAALAPVSQEQERPAMAAQRAGDGSWRLPVHGVLVPVRVPGAGVCEVHRGHRHAADGPSEPWDLA